MAWYENFSNSWENLKEDYDERFFRMWDFYLAYCQAGFKSKNIDLVQFSLQNR